MAAAPATEEVAAVPPGGGADLAFSLLVPGRVCLFGEHSDWAADSGAIPLGRTLVVGTNEKLEAHAWRQPAAQLWARTVTDRGEVRGPLVVDLSVEELTSLAGEGSFWSYAAGVALHLLEHPRYGTAIRASQSASPALPGVALDVHTCTLPLKKGLSSSAAVCVLVARTFSRLFGLGLSTQEEMEAAYQGERRTPSQCGRMDQACAFGPGTAVQTRYLGAGRIEVEPVRLGGSSPLHLIVCDLRAKKDTVRILAALQAAAREGLDGGAAHAEAAAAAGAGAPVAGVGAGLRQLLGERNMSITARAMAALEAGDTATLGALMTEAQAAFDALAAPACPDELTAPVLHRALTHPALQPFVLGGKGVGAGGDGSAQFVCPSAEAQAAAIAILQGELGMAAFPLLLLPASVPIAPPAADAVPGSLAPVLAAAGCGATALMSAEVASPTLTAPSPAGE